jgi:polysaccharide export outer membrane protein
MIRLFVFLAAMLTAGSAVAQSGNYAIREGDTLRVEVAEDSSLNRSVLVLPGGKISFPYAGAVQASGRTTSQVERALSTQMASAFASPPSVYVAVTNIPERLGGAMDEEEEETIAIYMLGEVAKPGLVEVKPGTTILQALSQAGGLSPFAATKRVQLRRRDPQSGQEYVYKINYRAISDGAALTGNVYLSEGDVILIPERRLFE